MYNMLHAAYPIPERMVYDMDLNKVVCNCLNITNGMIKDAVDAGARTFEEVQEATGAASVCGACEDDVRHLVDFFVGEQNK